MNDDEYDEASGAAHERARRHWGRAGEPTVAAHVGARRPGAGVGSRGSRGPRLPRAPSGAVAAARFRPRGWNCSPCCRSTVEAQEAFHARTLAISESPELLGAGCQVVGSILSVQHNGPNRSIAWSWITMKTSLTQSDARISEQSRPGE